jgi:NitT/TauT family transport system ATP-binding protein
MSITLDHNVSSAIGISASALSFSYGSKVIFQDIAFQIPDGEVWALMGRSGVGKTTLLNVILGVYRAKSGCVETAHGPVIEPGRVQGVVFSDSTLLWWMNVIENVMFPFHRKSDRRLRDHAMELLDLGGLKDAALLHPKELSTGMRRRVEVLRAFLLDDHYFIADEPFTALDIQSRLALYDVWRTLRAAKPRTGIICTHDPFEAAVLCDAVLMMQNSLSGTPTLEVIDIPSRFHNGEAAGAIFADPFLASLISAIR